MFKAFEVAGHGLELVSPFSVKAERVCLLPGAKLVDWQPVLETVDRTEQVEGTEEVQLSLPPPGFDIYSSKQGWKVAERPCRGITSQIRQRLKGRVKGYKKYTGGCVGVGIAVDKELKEFARGSRSFDSLQENSKSVVRFLWEKRQVSLVDGGVLVSNYSKEKKLSSATEIDLVGFDHVSRKFLIIELKVTSSSFQEMKNKMRRAKKDRRTGFRKSVLGRYIAQVVCTLKMFQNTYPEAGQADALLLVVEHRNARVFSLDISAEAFKGSSLRGMIQGYEF